MNNVQHSDYVTRDRILKLLSDAEVAAVSTAETAANLTAGDEFVDLAHLGRGVQCADGTATNMGGVLPRKSVHEQTWTKILTQLQPGRATGTP